MKRVVICDDLLVLHEMDTMVPNHLIGADYGRSGPISLPTRNNRDTRRRSIANQASLVTISAQGNGDKTTE
jgi:hypothetical protein